jgi:hypothetical protein
MDFRELFLTQHARAHSAEVAQPDFSNQDLILRDLTEEHLRMLPHPSFNSLAWLFWHMTRTEDAGINLIIAQQPQVLEAGGWIQQLKVADVDIATGMTIQEVEEFSRKVDVRSLLAYRAAVGKQTQRIIGELQPEVLDEKIGSNLIQGFRESGLYRSTAEWVPQRWLGKPKGFTLMHTVLAHTYFHIGQCEDIRSLLGFATL